jgi:hypothetical protein
MRRSEQDPQTLEPNTIAVFITEPQPKATVSIHLLDATSGVELTGLNAVEMAIAI